MRCFVPFKTMTLVFAALLGAGGVRAQSEEVVTPSRILEGRDGLMGKEVAVQGTVENAGTNFFTDRRLILRERPGGGSFVDLQGGGPFEKPLPQQTVPSSPLTISEALGKEVVIKGRLVEGIVKGVGAGLVLRVESIEPSR